MARDKTIKILRATRANLDTQKNESGLLAGEPYLITDEDRIAIGTGADAYSEAAKKSETTKVFVLQHIWAVSGEIKVASGDTDFIVPVPIAAPTGQIVELISVRYKINSGTSAVFKLQQNGSDITGYTGLTAGTTWAETSSDIALSDNDDLAPVITSVSGTPMHIVIAVRMRITVPPVEYLLDGSGDPLE